MSKTILAQVDGFTPVIDGMIPEVGLISAAVFGKAWRYCQMADGVCRAAQERIADELGLSRATVNAHFKNLCDAGYLEDTTPNLLGLPHIYRDTGKANLSISFTGTTTTCKNTLQPPVKNIDTKKEVNKQDTHIYNAHPAKNEPHHQDPVIAFMFSKGITPNARTHDHLKTWRERHTDERIIQAFIENPGKGQEYVNKVLISWEANGYPLTRDEQVAAARKTKPTPGAKGFDRTKEVLDKYLGAA